MHLKTLQAMFAKDREIVPDMDEEAARWALRIDTGEIDPDTDTALQAWLAADPMRRGALVRAEAVLSYFDRGRALAGVIPRPQAKPIWIRRRLVLAAASFAVMAVCGWIMISSPRHYGTSIGEIRSVPLRDGSSVMINTQSAIQVDLEAQLRQVTLSAGEAWFKVAHDTKRPFVVSAGRVRVRAVGTAFSVRKRDDGADVSVTEGIVETWVVGDEARAVRVAAGSKAFVPEYEPPKLVTGSAEIERSLAWRDGQIALQGETLADAAAQFNRYNREKIVIADSGLAEEKLIGQFRATDPLAFTDAVSTMLGVSVSRQGDTLLLSRQK
jgi:transmembrane sensor